MGQVSIAMPDHLKRARTSIGPWAALVAWLLAVAYLGGLASLIPFVLMVAGLLLPGAALLADGLRGTGLSDEMRACAGAALALLLTIAVYRLRRALPLPPLLFDLAAMAAVLAAALSTGAMRRYLALALAPSFRAAGWLLAGVIPGAACLVWMGFEVHRADIVRYYGLLTIDFSNLAGIVALIKGSPAAPQFVTAGSGPLNYHWWFFSIAAWLSGFLGTATRSSSALALSNLVAAVLLGATLCAFVTDHLRARAGAAGKAASEAAGHRLAAWTAAIIIVAPFSTYAYQFLIGLVHRPWFSAGFRNNLFLSILNSMSTFGNNTLALALVIIIVTALAALERSASWILAGLAGVAGLGIFGLSITLTIPLALAGGVWLLLGKVRRPLQLVAAACLIGAAGLPLLRASDLLGGSSLHLVVSFDRGQFLQNVAFGMAPIWILAGAALVRPRLSLPVLILGACVLVPTFVELTGHGSTPQSMSMKMASLLAVAAAPLVAEGMAWLLPSRVLDGAGAHGVGSPAPPSPRTSAWRLAASLAVLAGLANSLVYTLQFAAYRVTGRDGGRSADLPADYVEALDYVRQNSPASAVVVDPDADRLRDSIATLLIAERQGWLPTRYSAELVGTDRDNAEIMSRLDTWHTWKAGQFSDEALAGKIARSADILIGPLSIQSAHWERRSVTGAFAVYASLDRRPR